MTIDTTQPAAISGGISNSSSHFVRPLHKGMGQAVAERTILRRKPDGSWETWGEVADRVALGNALLAPTENEQAEEFELMRQHLAKATLLMSGRHLQHGDADQPNRPFECFSNCATAPASFLLFYLLLNGSGVGRCYDDDMMLVNWDNAPTLRVVLDHTHPDFSYSAHESVRDARHKYGQGRDVLWFRVPDSREGWAKAVEAWEVSAFERIHKDKMLILDFSDVRPAGQPIKGMQNRPSSGPVPLMNAFLKAASLRGTGIPPWMQTLYVDHYLAECVLVGGARRAARMATKSWRDPGILDFIRVKRPIEFAGLTPREVEEWRAGHSAAGLSFLWSANNSIAVDAEFWELVKMESQPKDRNWRHAQSVYAAATQAAYYDGTGEPGFLNVDKLVQNDEGWSGLEAGDYVGSPRYQVDDETPLYLSRLAKHSKKKKWHTIVNPCGEIPLSLLGGFCVIADVVPFHADSLEEAEEAFRVATRALIRVNTMPSIFPKEVARTNRIGVGMTGVHEFAWKFFQVGFRDLINPDCSTWRDERKEEEIGLGRIDERPRVRAAAFWETLARFHNVVEDEAEAYSAKLGLPTPHTAFTVKPSGTVSKLFGLTEGWHLPALAYMVRWVQFRSDDPLVKEYKAKGYPVRQLVKYQGTSIVGFPTAPVLTTLGL
jgi:adenosylcobalamin-dependent ribonucleoside-triphosphate reductase